MIVKKELIKREIAGDTILVPVGKTVLESNGLFMLNELGSFIWDILPVVDTEEEIHNAVMEQYDVSAETVKKDVADFMQKLKEMNII